ncbi:hypothetical protein HK104_001524 [Borealophlyctis nickersoniae]|nr:hypothetical protein HK104_001524 [Borealophlyctis nickersoniae]
MTIPRLNNFGDLQEYYLQKAMPLAISTIRTDNGTTPVEVRRFLVDLLEYNDNSNNEHSDNYFIASLLTALGDAFLPEVQPEKKPQSLALSAILSDTVVEVFNFADSDDEGEDNLREIFETDEGINLFKVAVKQIQRYIELDRIMPTYHNTVTVACLSVLTRWMLAGLVPVNLVFFLKHARYGHFLHVRMAAIDALFLLDGLHDEDVASYLLGLIRDDPAPFVRYHVAKTMATIMSLGAAEFNEANKAVSAEPAPMSKKASGWLKFKGDITQRSKFSTEVWNVMNHTPTLDHRIRLFLLKFCECLYEPAPGMVTAQPLKIKVGSKRAKSGQGYLEVRVTRKNTLQSSSDDEAVPSHPPKRGKTEKTTERPKPAVNGVKKRRSEAGVPAVKAVQPMEPPPPIEAAFLTTGEEILTRLLNHPSAAPFIHKVDETYAPGYSRMVQHPMDLSTVGRKLRSGSYANDIQLLAADVRQIFANCYIYNVEGSQVHNQAKKLEAFFDGEVLPEALGLKERPPPEEPPIKIEPLQVPVRAPAAPRRPSASNKPVSRRASSTPAPPASTQAPMTLLTQEESKRCRAMLKKLNSQKAAMWFKQPVDPMAQGIPTYFTIIKRPMDLSTVKAKLDNKQYTSLDDFESDIRLIFSNSFTFNPPDSPVYKDAASLLAYFQREWAQETASSAVVLSPSELSRCEAALQKMESRTAWVAPFLVPVDRSLFPHYYATTKEPIDISTIRKKLHSGTYSTTNEFEADVQLMFRNCFTFNLPGDPVYKQGLDLKQVFEEVWQGSGKDGASASKSELVATPAGRKERGGSEKTDATARKPKGKTLQTQSSLPPAGGEAESPVVSKSPSIVARVSRLLPSSPEGKICFKVLQRIQSQRMAGPFLVPVDPVALGIPQYFDIIKYPMDLGTVREKLDAGEYESAAAFADDMRLIFANAVAFNPPDHLVHQHAQALDKLFRKEWKAAGLDGRSGTPVSKASPTRSSPPTSSNNASRASPMSDPPTEISSSVQQKIREILRKLREHPRAGIFIGPVDGSIYADYYDKIKRPTDLATMETKLNNHAFATMQDFEAEFKQMIANCFTYNGKASEPAKWAMALEKAFKKEWAALTEKKATPTGTAKKRGAGSSRAGSTDPKSGLPQDARRECGLILDQLMQHPQALIFNTPVPRDVPGYHKAIKTPMDFGTIKQKLSENSYGSVHAFEADVRLVFSNCYKFNPAGGEVFRAMQSINELFDKAWKTFKGGKKRTADDFSDPEDIADAGKQKKTKQKHKKEEPPEDAEMDGDNPRKRSASAISYTKDGGVADRGKKKQKNERGDGDDGGKDDTNTPPAVSKPLKLKLKVKS